MTAISNSTNALANDIVEVEQVLEICVEQIRHFLNRHEALKPEARCELHGLSHILKWSIAKLSTIQNGVDDLEMTAWRAN